MSDTEIRLIAPRSQDWGAFECGDARISAPVNVLRALGMGEIDVPTLHLEVLAVKTNVQRQGLGKLLIRNALDIADRFRGDIGLKTVSLEATQESRAFYQGQGFESASSPWPDGSWPMWFLLE